MFERSGRFAYWALNWALHAPITFVNLLFAMLEVVVSACLMFWMAHLLCHVAGLPVVLAWIWAAASAATVTAKVIRTFFLGQGD